MPEGGQIARIECRQCGHVAELDPNVLRGLAGVRLFRRLKCSRCGARDASVSIRWEVPPARGIL
jgi:ribosomal protein L40E